MADKQFAVTHSDAEWRRLLTPEQYEVLRGHATEAPGSCASFNDPVEGAVETSTDSSFGMVRTEVHCSRCGSHLGHVFDDGPPPTHLRYCINGVAMNFAPE